MEPSERRHANPCLDLILEDPIGRVVVGWRQIVPYRNVCALPGARPGKGEHVQAVARTILAEHGFAARDLFLVSVFPMRFPSCSDFPVCVW